MKLINNGQANRGLPVKDAYVEIPGKGGEVSIALEDWDAIKDRPSIVADIRDGVLVALPDEGEAVTKKKAEKTAKAEG